MMVKICGITNSDDAHRAVDAGAAALGFNFYPGSPRYIPPEAAAQIAAALPPAVWKVGVFVNETADKVLDTAAQVGLDIAQLHGHEQPTQYPKGIRVWKAFRWGTSSWGDRLAPPHESAEAILLDGLASGQVFDWGSVPGGIPRLILAGGLDAGNVRAAIQQVHPWGVDACSRIESSPGRKDHLKMAAFLKAAMAASQ